MPEIFRSHGYRFFFYSNEGNEPPHVHVEHAGGNAKFWLNPTSLAWSKNMKAQELRSATEMIEDNWDEVMRAWRNEHGA